MPAPWAMTDPEVVDAASWLRLMSLCVIVVAKVPFPALSGGEHRRGGAARCRDADGVADQPRVGDRRVAAHADPGRVAGRAGSRAGRHGYPDAVVTNERRAEYEGAVDDDAAAEPGRVAGRVAGGGGVA